MKFYEQIRISLEKYRLEMKALEDLHLPPFKGSTFRGAFGNIFKNLICIQRHRDCPRCFINKKCIYTYIFETPLSGDSVKIQGETKHSAHPFIIEPPELTSKIIPEGMPFSANLVLIGAGIEFMPYFLYSFRKMGRKGIGKGRGKFDLIRVIRVNQDKEKEIYNNEQQLIISEPLPVSFEDLINISDDSVQLEIEFITPTRLINRGKFSQNAPFELVMRALFRRINQLNLHHCGADSAIDFGELLPVAKKVNILDSSLNIWDWERYSSRQKQYIKMAGIVGNVYYKDVPSFFIPFLRLAEYIHIGKYAVFGMGKLKINII